MHQDVASLELRLVDILGSQGLAIDEIRLIGLLGKGSRATVFSVSIDDVYHVLKVYDSAESLKAEYKHLKRIIPKDKLLFSWQEIDENGTLNLIIIEVPEGKELNAAALTDDISTKIGLRLAELHRIRYRQKVSVRTLRVDLELWHEPSMNLLRQLGLDVGPYEELYAQLFARLDKNPDSLRVPKVRIHGDMWWPNIIYTGGDIYLIDWESVRRGDAAEDIAKLRIYLYWPRNYRPAANFFWRSAADATAIGGLMQAIVDQAAQVRGDDTLADRLSFYLPYYCLRELARRSLMNQNEGPVSTAINQFIADDALALARDPFAEPQTLTNHNYYSYVESADTETPYPIGG